MSGKEGGRREAKKPSPGTDGHEDVFLHCLHTFVATVKDGHKSFGDFCLEWEAVTILVNFGAGHSHGIGEGAVVLFDAAAAAGRVLFAHCQQSLQCQ